MEIPITPRVFLARLLRYFSAFLLREYVSRHFFFFLKMRRKKEDNREPGLTVLRTVSPTRRSRFCQTQRDVSGAPFVIDVVAQSGARKTAETRSFARTRTGFFFHVSSRVVNAYGTVAIYGRTSAKTFGTDKSRRREQLNRFSSSREFRNTQGGRRRRRRRAEAAVSPSFGRVFLLVTRSG